MDVSIIIVNYNTKSLLLDCLKSVYQKTAGLLFEVLISDNGSTDGSVSAVKNEFPQVTVIENKANLGFGSANNRALAKATGKYVFYLNSDTVLLNNAVKIFFDYWEKNCKSIRLGALGCKLKDVNNEYMHNSGNFPEPKATLKILLRSVLSCYLFRFIPHKPTPTVVNSGCVDYVTGADLFMLNNSYARFDESYFMYCEEVDMQKKLADLGYERIVIDGPEIMHLEGASSHKRKVVGVRFNTFSSINTYVSNLLFMRRYYKTGVALKVLPFFITVIWNLPGNRKATAKYRKAGSLFNGVNPNSVK